MRNIQVDDLDTKTAFFALCWILHQSGQREFRISHELILDRSWECLDITAHEDPTSDSIILRIREMRPMPGMRINQIIDDDLDVIDADYEVITDPAQLPSPPKLLKPE